jgi:tetratricopeptide (TPR) repeat protein
LDISTSRSRLLVNLSIGIGVVSLVAIGAVPKARGSEQNSAFRSLAIAIKQEIAKLHLKPRTTELISEKAVRVRDAIRRGDYSNAREMIANVLKGSRLENWRYYPFSEFVKDVAKVNDSSLNAPLDKWVAQSKNDPIPLLIRAQYFYDMGWFRRGSDYASKTRANDLATFAASMKKALADIDAAIRLDDHNPYSFLVKLRILQGFGLSKKMMSAFKDAIAKYPRYYPPYAIVLDTLQPKWGGTLEKMYAFVSRYAGNAPKYSPLKLLYLNLYNDLLNLAWIGCTHYEHENDLMDRCVDAIMSYAVRPGLVKQVKEALQLYDHSDKHQFDIVIGRILPDMLDTAGGGRYAGRILLLAANAMHSDTQLVEDKPGHNDYVIDEAAARYWYYKKLYDNARLKYEEALRDVDFASFPDEEEKDVAIAAVYDNLAKVSNRLGRYADAIAYEKAAIAMGGRTGDEIYICYGYYKLNDYDDAVRACTKLINRRGSLNARYWRAMSYWRSGRKEAALPDLDAVADSEKGFRTSAAINLAFVYAKRKEFQESLDALNKYNYLFDPNTQNKEQLAISYNNRCYDYMKLGELKKALEDCTASLKYGNLPDALRKEQELIKRLKAHEKGS